MQSVDKMQTQFYMIPAKFNVNNMAICREFDNGRIHELFLQFNPDIISENFKSEEIIISFTSEQKCFNYIIDETKLRLVQEYLKDEYLLQFQDQLSQLMIFHDNIPGIQMMKIKDVNDVIQDLLERKVIKEYVGQFEILFETKQYDIINSENQQVQSTNLNAINQIICELIKIGKLNLVDKILIYIVTGPDQFFKRDQIPVEPFFNQQKKIFFSQQQERIRQYILQNPDYKHFQQKKLIHYKIQESFLPYKNIL